MTGDQTPNTKPEVGKTTPDPAGAQRSARKLLKELNGPVDEEFKESLAGLSRQLKERVSGQSENDSRMTAEARKAALQAYDLERTRRLKAILKIVGGVALTASITGLVVFIAAPFDRPLPRATAPVKPIEVAAVAPILTPSPVSRPTAVSTAVSMPASEPAASAPPVVTPAVTQAALAPAVEVEKVRPESSLEEAPLQRADIREIQTKLRAFGFNPGPLDGVAGRTTQAAIMHYQQNRELPQTGTIDRQLLEQLRQDPAPEVVAPQVVQRPARPARASGATRSSDPFDPLRTAAQDFERWLQSLGR
ncbi:peptidoglycan-binding protein [Reyranella sp.]|uniref:peptidoglycan-binding protein n=1 Tax=Reyranella sp. TaxID=1929291 RepID=UPI001221C660|nr:peptidoglycan-binding protein [Reyranella sp.]TAJ90513.1 MAG: hypothetical protein EPO50_01960 [Reyranella sp.]